MLAAYFCNSRLSQVDFNFSLMKEDWVAACIALRVVGAVLVIIFSGVRIKFGLSSANGKQGLRPEEMSQILLTNKKQGNLD